MSSTTQGTDNKTGAPTLSTNANGKAPDASTSSPTGTGPAVGFRSQNNGTVKVQPARLEDLQPAYAQTLQHDSDNPAAHGWYASMSEFVP
jgi:hypothetical protein